MMANTDSSDPLAGRRLVLLPEAASALRIEQRLLRRLMADAGIAVIELSERRRGISLADLDRLLAAHARPAA